MRVKRVYANLVGLHARKVTRHPSMSVKDDAADHNYGLATRGSQCAISDVNGLQHLSRFATSQVDS
jgi:hypothetical protein